MGSVSKHRRLDLDGLQGKEGIRQERVVVCLGSLYYVPVIVEYVLGLGQLCLSKGPVVGLRHASVYQQVDGLRLDCGAVFVFDYCRRRVAASGKERVIVESSGKLVVGNEQAREKETRQCEQGRRNGTKERCVYVCLPRTNELVGRGVRGLMVFGFFWKG